MLFCMHCDFKIPVVQLNFFRGYRNGGLATELLWDSAVLSRRLLVSNCSVCRFLLAATKSDTCRIRAVLIHDSIERPRLLSSPFSSLFFFSLGIEVVLMSPRYPAVKSGGKKTKLRAASANPTAVRCGCCVIFLIFRRPPRRSKAAVLIRD